MAKKILIVDDEQDVIIFLQTLLNAEGYETVTAMDGSEALEKLKAEKPDLITLDLQMPKNTGTDFYRSVRHNKEFKEIPVIVVSGLPGKHLAIPKPYAVFDKPIDKQELVDKVKEAIG
ncbi:MAG: response regulator [candidate division Zixibacteria bacterium]|jgi:CheY-like chemotaxis protein|nr:response regulator [candidate division Zixibacteria bacterium]